MKRKTNHTPWWQRCAVLSLALCALSSPLATAQSDVLSDDAPSRYTVAEGDTLWDIAGRFLSAPWQWPEVWQVNPQISDPNRIYPGDSVYLYYHNGQPRLGLERGQGDVVHLSPQVRRIPPREAIPALPLDTVQNFLDANRIVEPGTIEAAAYVVAGDDRRIISGAGDRIYVRGELPVGERFGLYRPGQRYVDPETGEFLGQELVTLGEARLLRREGGLALLEIVSSRQEIRAADLVLPLESLPVTATFQPRAPATAVEGQILSVPGAVRYGGRLDVVALDLGRRDGLAPGHVLVVEQLGERVIDPVTQESLRLPGEKAGLLMVFRVYDRVSYALVMHATRNLAVGDQVHTPRSDALLAGGGGS